MTPSLMNWTDEKLAALDKGQLINLLDNLHTQRESGRVAAEVADDLSSRISARLPARAKTVRRKRARSQVMLEARVAQQLGSLATTLAERYDLSAETAQKLSNGIKGFRPQPMTDRRGEARTGGSVKSGRMAIDRYIAYRVRDSMASLAFLLPADAPNEAGRYVLMATDDLLDGEHESEDFAAIAREHGWSESSRSRMRAVQAANYAEAEKLYETVIARAAAKLP
jgi:hypothetical protein